MDYEKKYKDALERASQFKNRDLFPENTDATINYIFPELQESEDERIRKWCVSHFRECFRVTKDNVEYQEYLNNKVIPWLEKQGEHKPADKVESKFHEGEWVVFDNHHDSAYQIEKIENYEYTLRHFLGGSMPLSFSQEDMIRAWTIRDAKDGDVLVYNHQQSKWIFIFKNLYSPTIVSYYVIFTEENNIYIDSSISTSSLSRITPATKEQRDFLFTKMKEAGYEWNVGTKELIRRI